MEQDTRTLEEIEHAGYYRGRNCASWAELPEIGSKQRWPDEVRPREVESTDDQWELVAAWAYASESADRDFTPFEFTACAFNNRDDAEACWEAFNAGIAKGIDEEVAARRAKYETTTQGA